MKGKFDSNVEIAVPRFTTGKDWNYIFIVGAFLSYDFCVAGHSRTKYETHCRIHDNVRPFQCTLCKKAFRSKERLNRHKINVHSKDRFQCKECPKWFKTKKALKHHVQREGIHQIATKVDHQNQCDECGAILSSAHNLSAHVRRYAHVEELILLTSSTLSTWLSIHLVSGHIDEKFDLNAITAIRASFIGMLQSVQRSETLGIVSNTLIVSWAGIIWRCTDEYILGSSHISVTNVVRASNENMSSSNTKEFTTRQRSQVSHVIIQNVQRCLWAKRDYRNIRRPCIRKKSFRAAFAANHSNRTII